MTTIWALSLALALAALPAAGQATAPKTPPASASSGARMEIEPEIHDFGKAKQDLKLEKDFVIKNTGSEELVIGRISTSCGCTAAEPAKKSIKPGESTTMKVTLETRRYAGPVERTVAIASNDPRRVKSLRVKVFVEESAAQK